MKKFVVMLLLNMTLLLGNNCFAISSDRQMYRCMQTEMRSVFDKLNLTDDQKVQIQALKHKARSSSKSNFDQLKTMREQMHTLVLSNKMDEAKLDSLIDSSTKLKAALLKNRIMTNYQIYNILNDNQKTQFQTLKAQAENTCMKATQ